MPGPLLCEFGVFGPGVITLCVIAVGKMLNKPAATDELCRWYSFLAYSLLLRPWSSLPLPIAPVFSSQWPLMPPKRFAVADLRAKLRTFVAREGRLPRKLSGPSLSEAQAAESAAVAALACSATLRRRS